MPGARPFGYFWGNAKSASRVRRETKRPAHAVYKTSEILKSHKQQKTRRSGFFSDHPNILSAATLAMVDRP
jgi:hypothetical protein